MQRSLLETKTRCRSWQRSNYTSTQCQLQLSGSQISTKLRNSFGFVVFDRVCLGSPAMAWMRLHFANTFKHIQIQMHNPSVFCLCRGHDRCCIVYWAEKMNMALQKIGTDLFEYSEQKCFQLFIVDKCSSVKSTTVAWKMWQSESMTDQSARSSLASNWYP